ncbi:thermonuclease family protein [Geoalkalibacter halelectricus]|uniref:Thermonuclease family protein n=1 Tax=Geoalkalibacter halelectricus TaxID=2847045 RepID=A0ABY5ZMJ9_9BACT|nr:thermonuclease family protein [Geoalkalibacter halelectricus]MDO3378917.1 thermonuclease family protein [Geoalkalibacter halelectricus]UWZ79060.1 thermonuclease family protein [Geoalkalibacter halelectricus]
MRVFLGRAFLLRLVVLILLFLLGQALSACASETRGRVAWIFDGDTIEIEALGRVRLLGIDTPEGEDSHRDLFYQRRFGIPPEHLRKIAREALRYNIRHVKGQVVTLRFEGERRDAHGRLRAYVILPDGRNLNRLLVEEGLAAVYRRIDFSHKQDFLRAEEQARRLGKGLWAQSQ